MCPRCLATSQIRSERDSNPRYRLTRYTAFPDRLSGRGAWWGIGGHHVFEIDVASAPGGRLGNPRWDSVGSGVTGLWVPVRLARTLPKIIPPLRQSDRRQNARGLLRQKGSVYPLCRERLRSYGHSFAAILNITAAAPTISSGETASWRNTTPITFAKSGTPNDQAPRRLVSAPCSSNAK
jgi:hypothetical protein